MSEFTRCSSKIKGYLFPWVHGKIFCLIRICVAWLNLVFKICCFICDYVTEQEELVRSFERSQAQQTRLWRVWFWFTSFYIILSFVVSCLWKAYPTWSLILSSPERFHFHVDGVCGSSLLLHSLSFVLHLSAGFITMGTGMSLPVPFGHLKLRIHAFVQFLMAISVCESIAL